LDWRADASGRPEDRVVPRGKPHEVRLSFLGLAGGLRFGEVCVGNQILVIGTNHGNHIIAKRRHLKTTAILPSRTWPAKQVTMPRRQQKQMKEKPPPPVISLGKVIKALTMKRHVAQMRSGEEGDNQSTLSPAPLPRSLFFPFASNPFPALPALPPKIPAV
jgi:hypothetical protein